MPKRKAVAISEDGMSDSDEYNPGLRSASKKQTRGSDPCTTPKKRKKRVISGVNTSQTQESAATVNHSKSDHVLRDPKSLQEQLLGWYSDVSEARGMPWRKPFNPSLTPLERNQRAYEVRCI
jgi:A/G-specific adenine glycosylase